MKRGFEKATLTPEFVAKKTLQAMNKNKSLNHKDEQRLQQQKDELMTETFGNVLDESRMQDFVIKGKNILNQEIGFSRRISEDKRVLVKVNNLYDNMYEDYSLDL